MTFLIDRGRLESIQVLDPAAAASTAVERGTRRLRTATGGLEAGDPDGAYAAAYDAYRMAAEALLIRQGLRASGGEGSHVTVEDAVSAQFAGDIEEFAKPTFERFRRMRHMAQYFDPSAAPTTVEDAEWALERSRGAIDGVRELLAANPPDRFEGG
ncbi:MAG: hypothetical protein QOG43_3666 [Actinomycetota bacterium]|nr:hypothetical protein [Actinomycetota bacterium]